MVVKVPQTDFFGVTIGVAAIAEQKVWLGAILLHDDELVIVGEGVPPGEIWIDGFVLF